MKQKYTILIILLFAITVTLAFVNINNMRETSPTIKIGTILSETGFASAFGEQSRRGIDLAVEEINAQGGINGRRITIIHEDDRTDPKTAVGLYKKLTAVDNVDAIIGSTLISLLTPSLRKRLREILLSSRQPVLVLQGHLIQTRTVLLCFLTSQILFQRLIHILQKHHTQKLLSSTTLAPSAKK